MRRLWLPALVVVLAAGCGRKAVVDVVEIPVAPSAPRELVDHPQYKSWAGCKPGTSVVQRMVTQTAGQDAVTTTTTTFTLLELTGEQAVVQMQASTKRYDGAEFKNPPEKFTIPKMLALPPGKTKEDFGKPDGVVEQGERTVTVGGKEYRAKWFKGKGSNEAGEVFTEVWSSEAVPGGLLKSVTHTPGVGKTTTIELVEVMAH